MLRVMIKSFRDKDTHAFYEGRRVRRFGGFAAQARKRLQVLDAACGIADLAALHSNRFEKLRGDRAGQYSIRVSDQWRLCFRWAGQGPEDVEIVDYH